MARKRSIAVVLGAGLSAAGCDEARTPIPPYPPQKPVYPWMQQARLDECRRPEDFQRPECHKRPAVTQSHGSTFVWIMHSYNPAPAYRPTYAPRYVPQAALQAQRAAFVASRSSVPTAGFRAPSYPGPSPAATAAVSRGGFGATGASIATTSAS